MATTNNFKVKNGLEIPSLDTFYATDVAAPSVRPSLDLNFVGTKKIDPKVTFSRASTGTCYDGKTVVKAEENLLSYSDQFDNAFWSKSNASVTANATTAPDGTTTADQLVEDASTTYHYLYKTYTATVGNSYTHSVYAKANTRSWMILWGYETATDKKAFFDLANGVVGNVDAGVTASIGAVGNGWYRCSITWTSAAASSYFQVVLTTGNGITTYTGNGTSGIYIWGAQIEQRSAVAAYTPTTAAPITNYIPALQTASANTARFDHNPVTNECKGLLYEDSKTNLILYSENFDSSTTNTIFAYASVACNATIAPDGNLTADKIYEDTTNNRHEVSKTVYLTNGTTYTYSVYVKPAGRNYTSIGWSGNPMVGFDLSTATGAVSAPVGATFGTIAAVGNGWFRITSTFTATLTATYQLYHCIKQTSSSTVETYTGDGYSGLYVWGAQLETSAYASSYIPTLPTYTGRGSTATYKAADGLMRIAQPNVVRYEPNAVGGSNLLLEGAATNAVLWSDIVAPGNWSATKSTLSFNAIQAPDGSMTGAMLSEDTTNDYHFAMQSTARVSGTTYCYSVYVKPGSATFVSVSITGNIVVEINLSTGATQALGSPTTYGLIDVGGGWKRAYISYTAPDNTAQNVYIQLLTTGYTRVYTGASKSAYFWGAQLETGVTYPTSYIPSTETWSGRSSTATYYDSTGIIRTALSGQPRYSYNPSLLTAASHMLLESAATNLAINSSAHGTWYLGGTSVSSNAAVAPDGSSDADLLYVSTTGTQRGSWMTITWTSGTVYTYSTYVKPNTWRYIGIGTNNTTGETTVFDLTQGVVARSNGYFKNETIQYVGNGWYRISITHIGGTSGTNNYYATILLDDLATANGTANGTNGVYIWGTQVEVGYAPTSYIPTTGTAVTRAADTATSASSSRAADIYSASAVTRAADLLSSTGTAFNNWFNPNSGTLYFEATSPISINYYYNALNVRISKGSVYDMITMGNNTGYGNSGGAGSVEFWVEDSRQGGNEVFGATSSLSLTTTANVPWKVAGAYAVDNCGAAFNGQQLISDTSASLPQGLDRLEFKGNSSYSYNGLIRRFAYYPARLTNAELQALTIQ